MSLNIFREISEARYSGHLSFVGSGAYANVYSNNTDKVIKVGNISDAYIDYVEYCLNNQGRDYIPNIHAYVRDEYDNYAVVLDKYSHTLRFETGCFAEFSEAMSDPYGRFNVIRRYYPDMMELIEELQEDYPDHFFDLHRNNFMISYDRKLYLIDPFTGNPTSTSSDKYSSDGVLIQNYIQKIC